MKFQVVYKKSEWELRRDSPDQELRQTIEENGKDAKRWKLSHDNQERSLDAVIDTLDELGADYDSYYRAHLDEEIDADVVIAVGGDGTLLETAHYVTDAKIMGVNSDPNTSVGYFSLTNADGFRSCIEDIENLPVTQLQRMQVERNGWVIPELILNDLLISDKEPAAQSKYRINDRRYRDSGLLICTPAGSTAWMYQEDGEVMPLSKKFFQYRARGKRNAQSDFASELTISSLMREGMLYVDGSHVKYNFSMGDEVRISQGKPISIIGDLQQKQDNFVALDSEDLYK